MSSNDIIFSKTATWELHGEPKSPGWYFWDETWAHCHGPFVRLLECRATLQKYMIELEGDRQ